MRQLHSRYTITTKIVSERKLIALNDSEYSVSQMALQLGGFNIHMAQNRHGPELKYRIGVLIPNHSGLKQSLNLQSPAKVKLRGHEYLVLQLEGDGQHLRERVERAFRHIQQALSEKSEEGLGHKRQWELLAEDEAQDSWVSCYISPAENLDHASQAYRHLSTRFEELNADFRKIKARIICPSLNKHAQWIWKSFIYKLGTH